MSKNMPKRRSVTVTAADMGDAEPSEGVFSARDMRSFARTASAAGEDVNDFVAQIQRTASVEMYENFGGMAVSGASRPARERSGLSQASRQQAIAGDPSDADFANRAANKMITTLRSGKRNTACTKLCSPISMAGVTNTEDALEAAGPGPRPSSVFIHYSRFTPYPMKRGGSDRNLRTSLSLPSP